MLALFKVIINNLAINSKHLIFSRLLKGFIFICMVSVMFSSTTVENWVISLFYF